MARTEWNGIFSVLVTPFTESGDVNLVHFDKLCRMNLENGADGLIVLGSTGEFYSLSTEEKHALIDAAVDLAQDTCPLLVGIAGTNVREMLALGRYARSAGADGLLVLPPIYAMPDEREVEAFFTKFAQHVDLPIMLYNSPKRTGVSLGADLVGRLLKLPNIVAIKDSSGSIVHVSELARRFGGEIAVFVGYETMIRPSLAVGGCGVVAMAHQLSGRLVRAYYDACDRSDDATADRLEPALFAIYKCFGLGSFYAGIKAVMNEIGEPVGVPREPLLPFSNAQLSRARTILTEEKVASIIRSVS